MQIWLSRSSGVPKYIQMYSIVSSDFGFKQIFSLYAKAKLRIEAIEDNRLDLTLENVVTNSLLHIIIILL